jgi:predicted metalloprotease with PDZ domain
MLVWLEADAIIRRETAGAKGMDDFAQGFFGVNDGDWGINTYDFNTLVTVLNAVTPYDWAGFLHQRLTEKAGGAPLAGFTASGYKLIYTEKPTTAFAEGRRGVKVNNLSYSGGLVLGKDGKVEQVIWDSAAFAAGLTVSDEVVGVNEKPYSEDGIKAAITAAKGGTAPIRLIVRTADRLRAVALNWNQGLRYPRFEKTGPDGALDKLLAAK